MPYGKIDYSSIGKCRSKNEEIDLMAIDEEVDCLVSVNANGAGNRSARISIVSFSGNPAWSTGLGMRRKMLTFYSAGAASRRGD